MQTTRLNPSSLTIKTQSISAMVISSLSARVLAVCDKAPVEYLPPQIKMARLPQSSVVWRSSAFARLPVSACVRKGGMADQGLTAGRNSHTVRQLLSVSDANTGNFGEFASRFKLARGPLPSPFNADSSCKNVAAGGRFSFARLFHLGVNNIPTLAPFMGVYVSSTEP